LAELALSGCTTSSDHQYLFPNGSRLDNAIEAAGDIGMRFTATRGSMSIGESKGGLPPDILTEPEHSILADCLRVVDEFHDASRHAMTRVALAPCSPFSVSRELMRDTAIMAADKSVGLHTHLAENVEDIDYSLEHFNMRPGDYAEIWAGQDHMSGMPIAFSSTPMKSTCSPVPAPAWRIAHVPICGWPVALHPCARCWMQGFMSGWAWMAHHPAIAAIC
jgi:hypothetical protein